MKYIDEKFWKIEGISHGKLKNTVIKHIISGIIEGVLKPGEKIPSIRKLVELNVVNRSSVERAYVRLKELGWLKSENNGGTFVSHCFPGHEEYYPMALWPSTMPILIDPSLPDAGRSEDYSMGYLSVGLDTLAPTYFSLSKFYSNKRVHLDGFKGSMNLQGTKGLWENDYRDCLLGHLKNCRYFPINSENLTLFFGRRDSLYAVLYTLLNSTDMLLNTSPMDEVLSALILEMGLRSIVLNVTDPDFMGKLELLLEHQPIKVLYIRPQCTLPEGMVLPPDQCERLIELAQAHKFYIIEEDDHHEFWYKLAYKPLVRYEHYGHVLYLGAVSQIHPYLIATRTLVAVAELVRLIDRMRPPEVSYRNLLAEKAFIDFINEGGLLKWSRKARIEKRRHLYQCHLVLKNYFAEVATIHLPETGLNLSMVFHQNHEFSAKLDEIPGIKFNLPPRHFDANEVSSDPRFISIGIGAWNPVEAEQVFKGLSAHLNI